MVNTRNKQRTELLANLEESIAYRRANPAGKAYSIFGLKGMIQEAKQFNLDIKYELPHLQIDISKFEEELPQLETEEIK